MRRGGGGGDEEEEAVDEACWEFTRLEEDISTPVGGLMMGFLVMVRAPRALCLRLPRPTPCPLRPRRPSSGNTSSGSGSEGGLELSNMLASLSPWEDGERSSGSDKACVASEACESHDESSKLGLLDLEDSAEESWDTALEPQEAALLLNCPLVALFTLLLSRLAVVDETLGAGGGGGGRESTGAVDPVLVTAAVEEMSTGEGEGEAVEVEVGWADVETDEVAGSTRAIFMWGGGVPKLPSSSMKRLGVLIMRRETVLTTGMINCLIFFSWVLFLLLMPASMAPGPLPPMATASFSNSFFFCAPFLARRSSCLAMVASVRLEGGTIRTGFMCRGLCLRLRGLPSLEGDGEEGGLEESWSSAPSTFLSTGCWEVCGSEPLSPLTLKVFCFPSPDSVEVDSWAAAAAAAASALRRSAEGGRPRLRRGTPGKVLSRDLRGLSLTSLSLFSLATLDSPRPALGSLDSVLCCCAEPSDVFLVLFLSLSSSVSMPSSDPGCLLSSPAAWLPVFQAF